MNIIIQCMLLIINVYPILSIIHIHAKNYSKTRKIKFINVRKFDLKILEDFNSAIFAGYKYEF